jgi:hypothetical protein
MTKKKTKKTKKDFGSNKVSNIIAVIALAFSIGALLYSWNSDREKGIEYLRTNSERLITDENVRLYNGGYPGMILPTYWSCDLTNNGEKTISIVKYDIKRFFEKKNLMYYSNIDFGMHSQNFEKIKLPLNIKSGETKRILIKVGVSLYGNSTDILKRKLDSFKNYTFSDIKLILAKEKTDIFDNEVESTIKNDRIIHLQYKGLDPNKDYYNVTFETGKGKYFSELLHWYPFLK